MTAGLRAAAVQRPPNATGAPLFISYSRKDYYFAESLAFHLMRQDVPVWFDVKDLEPGTDWERGVTDALDAASAIVLVASPDSVRSPNVRDEWRRALQRGKRIVVARFRWASIPAELQQCAVVDFSQSFRRPLRALAGMLSGTASAASEVRAARIRSLGVGMPPWAAVMSAALALPWLAYLWLADWQTDDTSGMPPALFVLLLLGFVFVLLWFFCITFMRRRMGMTRLAICLVIAIAIIATPMLLHSLFAGTAATAYDASLSTVVRDHWRVGILLCAFPAAGLVVLLLVRPEDLLRWTPTGTAWPVYRAGHVAHAVFDRAALGTRLHELRDFRVVCDAVDEPAAEHLRQLLVEAGATEAGAGAGTGTLVMLLTNRTRTRWLDEQVARLPPSLLTVVGTPIGLPATMQPLWRRQWVDLRGWNLDRVDREKSLPQVPEAVGEPRYPAAVNRVHQSLCALAALVMILGGRLTEFSPDQDSLGVAQAVAFGTMLWWGLLARRLLRRSRTSAVFARDHAIGCAATIVAVGLCGYAIAMHDGGLGMARLAVTVALLVAAYAWVARQRSGLAFWFALQPPEKGAQDLAPPRSWRTLASICAYLPLWGLLFGAFN